MSGVWSQLPSIILPWFSPSSGIFGATEMAAITRGGSLALNEIEDRYLTTSSSTRHLQAGVYIPKIYRKA